jgi:hypothetical protein
MLSIFQKQQESRLDFKTLDEMTIKPKNAMHFKKNKIASDGNVLFVKKNTGN